MLTLPQSRAHSVPQCVHEVKNLTAVGEMQAAATVSGLQVQANVAHRPTAYTSATTANITFVATAAHTSAATVARISAATVARTSALNAVCIFAAIAVCISVVIAACISAARAVCCGCTD